MSTLHLESDSPTSRFDGIAYRHKSHVIRAESIQYRRTYAAALVQTTAEATTIAQYLAMSLERCISSQLAR